MLFLNIHMRSILIISLLIVAIKSFTTITNYGSTSSLDIISNHTLILKNGTSSYVGIFDSDNKYKVLKYSLSNSSLPVLLGAYILQSTIPKKIFIYKGYLFAYN